MPRVQPLKKKKKANTKRERGRSNYGSVLAPEMDKRRTEIHSQWVKARSAGHLIPRSDAKVPLDKLTLREWDKQDATHLRPGLAPLPRMGLKL